MVDEIGPCDNCGRDAAYAGEMDGKPTYFCCACTLAIVGWAGSTPTVFAPSVRLNVIAKVAASSRRRRRSTERPR